MFGELSIRDLLAKTLMAEAGGEGLAGMLAAGAVIDNRAKAGGYGDGIEGVITKPGQFSAWNRVTGYAGGKGGLDMDRITPNREAYQAADMILSQRYDDPTGGATHYYNPAAADPKWGAKAGGDWLRIGNHIFGNADAGRRLSFGPDIPAMKNPGVGENKPGLLNFLSKGENSKNLGLFSLLGGMDMEAPPAPQAPQPQMPQRLPPEVFKPQHSSYLQNLLEMLVGKV